MSHVRDLWTSPVRQRDGTVKREPNGRWGKGKRWQAVWHDQAGRQWTQAFAARAHARQMADASEMRRVHEQLVAAAAPRTEAELDAAGFYAYLLWTTREDDTPLCVGSSGNILGRLGSHVGALSKRGHIGWITLIRCTSEAAMTRRERGADPQVPPAAEPVHPGRTPRSHGRIGGSLAPNPLTHSARR
jgi:hypothetical protein